MSAALAEQKAKEVACPTGWVYFRRSCGTWQASPAGCRDLLCPDCQRRWAAEARERWFPLIEAMRAPRMLTLTVKSGFDLAERAAFERASFRRLLDLRLGPRSFPVHEAAALKRLAALLKEGKVMLEQVEAQTEGLESLWRRIVRYHDKHGEWPRVRDMLKCGLSSVEVTWRDEHGWHPHRHVVYDGAWLSQVLWSVLWHRATKGESDIVDIRYKRPDYDTALELVKYISKPGSVPAERADEFRSVLRHVKKIWPLGDAEPVEPEPRPCPFCGSDECLVEPWTVEVSFRHWLSPDGKEAHIHLAAGVVVVRKIDGVWREWWSLHLPRAERGLNSKHDELACHSRARDGPHEPSSEFDESLLEAAYGSKGSRWLQN